MSPNRYLADAVLLLAVMARLAAADDAQRNAELAQAELNIKKAKAALQEGRYQEAEPLAEQALAIRERFSRSIYPDIAEALAACGSVQDALGNHAAAESLYKRAIAATEKALGSDHPHVATALLLLATVYRDEGKYNDAERSVLRAKSIREKAFGTEHPKFVETLVDLARVYEAKGNHAEAQTLYKRHLSILETALGKEDPKVGWALHDLAGVCIEQKQYAEAEALSRRALAIVENNYGPNAPESASVLDRLGGALMHQRKLAEADEVLQRGLAIRQKSLRADHPDMAFSFHNLAILRWSQDNLADAEDLFRQALSIREAVFAPTNHEVISTLEELAELYDEAGKAAEAETVRARLLAVGGSGFTRMPPPDYSRWSGGEIALTFLGLVCAIVVLLYVHSIIAKRRYKNSDYSAVQILRQAWPWRGGMARMKYRKLRIAWSVGGSILCLLLIVFWIRSYRWVDVVSLDAPDPISVQVTSIKGLVGASIDRTGHSDWAWLSESMDSFDLSRALSHGQFALLSENGRKTVIVPNWFLIVLSGALSTAPWLPYRFSLRTLLIAMTVVAVLCAIIYAVS